MFYDKNAPFYKPELVNYNPESKIYKYKVQMKFTNMIDTFECSYNRIERRKLISLVFSTNSKGRAVPSRNVKRFLNTGLVFDFDTGHKFLDIFINYKGTLLTAEEKREKKLVRSNIHYYIKKMKKPIPKKEILDLAKKHNIKIPSIQVN